MSMCDPLQANIRTALKSLNERFCVSAIAVTRNRRRQSETVTRRLRGTDAAVQNPAPDMPITFAILMPKGCFGALPIRQNSLY
ncbi:hypothetical protein SDC9_211677 [bioreactor metagenome]|uniref:Uncharacterized protein n=1 Tax=bioreactor metagenome TaxID=1076179 RepID=A0A645JLC2_9ZZZZ